MTSGSGGVCTTKGARECGGRERRKWKEDEAMEEEKEEEGRREGSISEISDTLWVAMQLVEGHV